MIAVVVALILGMTAALGVTTPVSAAPTPPPAPVLVGDLNELGVGSAPREFAAIGDLVLFSATTQAHGRELWNYDVESGQIELVADIRPGLLGAAPSGLTVHDDVVYFAANDGVHGTELWRSDGTREGTRMVHDLSPGLRSSLPLNLVAFDGALHFAATTDATGEELFRTDGESIELVADIYPGPIDSDPFPLAVVAVDDGFDALYLQARTEANGRELVRYDVKYGVTEFDLAPGSTNSSPTSPAVIDDALFVVGGVFTEEQVWRIAGADATTLTPEVVGLEDRPLSAVAAGGRLFVRTYDGPGSDLVVLEGPTATPQTVIDDEVIQQLAPLGTGVFFVLDDAAGREPWFSGGTAGSTFQLADIVPGPGHSNPNRYSHDPSRGDAVFSAGPSPVEQQLWRTDGTEAGTYPLTDGSPHGIDGVALAAPKLWAFASSELGANGSEPWITTGARETTMPMGDVDTATESSNPRDFVRLGDGVLFAAGDGGERQLWASIPHGAVPQPVPGTTDREFDDPVSLGDHVVFTSWDVDNGAEPWVTDGTGGGTRLIGSIAPGVGSSGIEAIEAGHDQAFLIAPDSGIWVTDGTVGDLRRVFDGEVSDWAAIDGSLYFRGETTTEGAEPYVSDGTVGGTAALADLVPGAGGSDPSDFVGYDGYVWFRALDGLWRTAGAPGDVVEVAVPGGAAYEVSEVRAGHELLLWQEHEDDEPTRLLTSTDPTSGFDVVDVSGLDVEAISSSLVYPVEGATIVVAAPMDSREFDTLVRVDGATATVIHRIGDREYIDQRQSLGHLGRVYLVVEDADDVPRLMQTDGTAEGTVTIDVAGSFDQSHSLRELALVGDHVYYEASNSQYGAEPFRIDVGAGVPSAPRSISAVAGDRAATVSWAAPVDDGGRSIVSYTVTASPGGATCTTSTTSCTVSGLTGGTSYTFTVRADNGRYVSPSSAASNAVVPTAPEQPEVPGFTPLSPARLLESRSGVGNVTVDGRFEGIGRVGAGSVTELVVAGRGGVPVGASAVSLNVTAVRPSAAGHLTVFPCGGAVPTASNVNYSAGVVVPNAVLSRVGAGGKVCVFSLAETDLIVDVNGAFESGFASLSPARLLESRSGVGNVTVDGRFEGIGRVGAGSVTELVVAGRGGVPVGASAVSLNVTAVRPSAAGHLTVFPCGGAVPTASNVNYSAGVVVPNAVLSRVGAGEKVCVFSLAETDLIVDVNGAFESGFASLSPARLLESRSGVGNVTVDGRFEGIGRVGAGSVTELVVAGRGGVPVGASAVSLNVTAVRPSAAGHLTVFPCGGAVPTASNVNYSAGVVVPNAVLSRVGAGGKVCVFSLAETDLIVDVNGAFD